MDQHHEHVIKGYELDGLEDVVIQALQGEFGELSRLHPDDLALVDEFHIRGRAATVELAEFAGELAGARVLDVGCGLGGTARYLASTFGARVTGIDLTPVYISLAERLSQLVGLARETRFLQASAIAAPFHESQFEVAWMEHVQMNVPSKDRLALELARVLKEGGRVVLHEVFSATGGEPYLPVPWANVPAASFLVTPEDFCRKMEQVGFKLIYWKDVTQLARQWFDVVAQRLAKSDPPRLGPHLLMGEAARIKLANVGKNLDEGRICVVQAVFQNQSQKVTRLQQVSNSTFGVV